MKFQVRFTRSADGDLDRYRPYEQKLISDGIAKFLEVDADVETRRRRQLRPNPVSPWELKLAKYRVFYEIRTDTVVRILAIGHKAHNDLFIRGEKVDI